MDGERAKFATIVFFAGAATILAMAVFVYLVALCADRLSCINIATLTAEELEARRNATSVTKESGLAGLLPAERVKVYRAFFEKRSFEYFKAPPTENEGANDDDVEAQKVAGKLEELSKESTKAESEDEDEKGESEAGDEKPDKENENTGEESEEPACSICLNEYEDGERVIIGTACSHMFHHKCFMQWVDKENEDCPYCREHMIRAQDFFDTAKEILGEERVEKLKKVNDDAEARRKELEAARTGASQTTTDSTTEPQTTNSPTQTE